MPQINFAALIAPVAKSVFEKYFEINNIKANNDNNKEIYARIRIVDNDGMPQESIEGAI